MSSTIDEKMEQLAMEYALLNYRPEDRPEELTQMVLTVSDDKHRQTILSNQMDALTGPWARIGAIALAEQTLLMTLGPPPTHLD